MDKIEHLLNRKIVTLKGDLSYINNKRVLITGAGTIGTELCKQLLYNNAQRLYLLDHSEKALYNAVNKLKNNEDKIIPILGTLQDKNFVHYILNELRANVLLHTAAHKFVDLCEENPIECIKNNVFGLKNILDNINEIQIEKFILISTDKAVNPKGVYGLSKKICEDMVLSINSDKFIIARFGNVLASNGSVFNLFKNQIKKRGPITITSPNMKRFFMTKEEACSLLLQIGNIGEKNNIYILKMGKMINMVDFANRMMDIYNKKVNIEFIGLRKGEKLEEELFNENEISFDTKIDGIKALVGVNKPFEIDFNILEYFCNSRDKFSLLKELKYDRIL